jgi:hypothetical protein
VKIVVFGPDYRVGAWEGDRVIDLSRGMLFLKPGDLVEVSSPQIGMLRNRIVAK